ncbi:hypothetical protein HZC09_06960 [Candidatus Micrarchaeota archaeon]|nr:hypothetical protein [Candidatus Micrarchaeota archaeon]
MKEDMMEKALLVVALLAVFALIFFAFQLLLKKSPETNLDGLLVKATKDEISSVLADDPIRVEMRLTAGNSSKNTALTSVTAEIGATLAYYKRKSYAYGSVDGNASVNCVEETNYCSGAKVAVQVGGCNCLKVEDNKIIVEGTEDFFADFKHLKAIKGVFGVAVAG